MTTSRLENGRVELQRSDSEKLPLVQRLSRIEGQVRGLRNMIESDRYCLDEVTQINAVIAALREVSLLIIGQHVDQALQIAEDEHHRGDAMNDIRAVIRAAMKVGD